MALSSGGRIEKWDNLKGLLMILVVLGHIFDVYANTSEVCAILRYFIYIFHMPLFLFVSGLFSKSHVKQRNARAVMSYFLLFIVIKVLVFASKWVAYGKYPGFSLISTSGVAWYAFVLCSFCLITMAVDRFEPVHIFIVSIVIGCLAGYDRNLGDKLCLMRTAVFYPFFFAGYCLDEAKIRKFFSDKKIKIASAVLIAAGFLIVWFCYDGISDLRLMYTGKNSYITVFGRNLPYAFLLRLLIYAVSALMGAAFIAVTPEKSLVSVLPSIGRKTLQIYALHMPLKYLYLGLLNDRFHIENYFVSKLPLYSVLISAVLIAVCCLPFWGTVLNKVIKIPGRKTVRAENS